MTPEVQLALIGLAVVCANGLFAWIQSRKIHAVKESLEAKLKDQTVQAAVVEKKVDEVHVVVNNKADIAATEIEDLKGQVKALTEVLAKAVRVVNGAGSGPAKP